jgi:putative integral membrane protein (TIGR02587 family)
MQGQTTFTTSGARAAANHRSIATSLQEYARGLAGGLLFSLPLLYTMEVWWTGLTAHPRRVLVYVLATFLLLLGYNRYVGLRRDASFTEVVIDSIEELGLGLIIAAIALWLLGRVTFDMTATEAMGQIVVEAMTVAIGVSVGTAQLGGGDEAAEDTGSGQDQPADQGESTGAATSAGQFASQLVITLCGAVLVGANIAPTEEIMMIAVEISTWRLVGLALASLALGALILFYSDFTGARKYAPADETSKVLFGTVINYAVALASSAAILWFFGRFDGVAPIVGIAQTVVLGVAATLGASAGRLLLQSTSDT